MELLARRGINIAAVLLSLLLHAALLFGADRLIRTIGDSSSSNANPRGKITLVAMVPAQAKPPEDTPTEVVQPEDDQPIIPESETEPPPEKFVEVVETADVPSLTNLGSEKSDAKVLGKPDIGEAAGVEAATATKAAPLPRILPKPLVEIEPAYPFKARKLGHEGTVVLEVTISAAGTPLDCKIALSSGWPELDEEARKTVLASRFSPGQEEGRSVQDTLKMSIVFELKG